MRPLLRALLIVTVALAAVVLPFVAFGPQLEEHVEAWLAVPLSRPAAAAIVCGTLASDILLPVPSSAVSTFAGARLGLLAGTAASWLGMTAGASLGFGLARWFGRPLAVRLAGADEARRMDALVERYGPAVLVLTRALPVLAEAAVLVLGAGRLAWRRFLPPVLLANLGLSAAYAAFGQIADQRGALPAALVASVALPIAAAVVARAWWPKRSCTGGSRPAGTSGTRREQPPIPPPGATRE